MLTRRRVYIGVRDEPGTQCASSATQCASSAPAITSMVFDRSSSSRGRNTRHWRGFANRDWMSDSSLKLVVNRDWMSDSFLKLGANRDWKSGDVSGGFKTPIPMTGTGRDTISTAKTTMTGGLTGTRSVAVHRFGIIDSVGGRGGRWVRWLRGRRVV